jgi:hypothetical protein
MMRIARGINMPHIINPFYPTLSYVFFGKKNKQAKDPEKKRNKR